MKITLSIIGICIVVFIIQAIAKDPFNSTFSLVPALALKGYVWQFVTYMFLHGGLMHLFLNIIALFIFGITIENTLGKKKYLTLFFVSGVLSAVLYLVITFAITPQAELPLVMATRLIGVSGAAFAIMAAYGILYPRNWIIMFPGIPMPAIVAVAVFAAIEIFYGVTGLEQGVANWGHLGGLLAGSLMVLYWKKRSEKKPKLIIDDLEKPGREKDWEYVWE